MPQLVKGGKWIFGLTEVGHTGRIAVPPDAAEEYGFSPGDRLITMSASRSSGGFVLTSLALLAKTGFDALYHQAMSLAGKEQEAVKTGSRWLAATDLRPDLSIRLSPDILAKYGINSGDHLAVGRGSWAGISFLVRGPILEECRKHPGLTVFRDSESTSADSG